MMILRHVVTLTLALLAVVPTGSAQQLKRLVDLRGQWKFELGDDLRRADPAFDDGTWDRVRVPSNWEDQGYPGYDGFAWYRKHFALPTGTQKEMYYYLQLGRIDDVDEAYVNGTFIGFNGLFPPDYETAYASDRVYQVPAWCLNFGGDNVVAVRVYDSEMGGGIVHGEIGLYRDINPLYPDVSLDGTWKFRTGDDPSWSEIALNDAGWEDVHVPAYWETQGHRGYDGFGWYRLHFKVPSRLLSGTLILLLGNIDDVDEAFLNGERIGRTGQFSYREETRGQGDAHLQLRAYTVRPGLLAASGNVLAVRVQDTWRHGGIYRGPVGLISRSAYLSWRDRESKDRPGFWKWLDRLFD